MEREPRRRAVAVVRWFGLAGLLATTVLATAIALSPTLFGRSLAGTDESFGPIEVAATVLSVGAVVLIAVGGSRLVVTGVAVVVVFGLTLCQPFGVKVGDAVSDADVQAARIVPGGEHAAPWSRLPLLEMGSYTITSPTLSETNRDRTEAKVRSWLRPGFLNDATTFADSDVAAVQLLLLPDGGVAAAIISDGTGRVTDARRLSYGIASPAGAVYWLAAIAALAVGVRRLRSTRPLPASPAA